MDWLRRNWPDLLIGVALIAVIAGIIATLVSGGSFFPVGNRGAEQPRTPASATSGQTPGQSQSGVTQGAEPQQPTDQPPAVAALPVQGEQSPADEPAGAAAEPADQPAEPASSSVEALPPAGSQAQEPAQPAAQEPAAQEPAAQQPAATQPVAPASSLVSTPSQPAAAQPSASSTPAPAASSSSEAPYRVSVGAFASAENAQRQRDAFAAAGYPVFIGTQGNLNIVLVGPYDTEAQARDVAARISSSGLGVSDPTVYRLQEDEPAGAATPAPAAPQPVAQQPAATQPVAQAGAQPAAEAPAPTAAGRFLQVGAYGTRESSLPQRQRLEALGFAVSDRVESGLVKLLVGPFEAAELAPAQERLQAAGIESFAR